MCETRSGNVRKLIVVAGAVLLVAMAAGWRRPGALGDASHRPVGGRGQLRVRDLENR